VRAFLSRELVWWGVLAAAAVGLIVLVYFALPGSMVDGNDFKTDAERLKAENDVRSSGVQAVGAIAVVVGAFMTARTFLLSRRGQLKDRLNKAVEQLTAKENLAMRLGAVAQLKRIAQEGEADMHWEVVEILTAYLRENAEWKDGAVLPGRARADVQAIVDALGSRDTSREGEEQRLDLRRTDLRRVIFKGAHLERADLFEAHLEHAISTDRSRFDGASLVQAVLDDARVSGAHFNGAKLTSASARRAKLEAADLTGAELTETKLQGANLTGAIGAALHVAKLDATTLCPDGSFGPDCGSA
jgi:hypothetical protein